MAVPARILARYQQSETELIALGSYVSATLRSFCDRHGYTYLGRRKGVESVSEKIETGRFASWSSLDDLYAATIVVPSAAHEDRVLAFLNAVFAEVALRRRGTAQKAPDIFRFDATRFIGRVREETAAAYTPGIDLISFEVQVLTVFEHAWTVATHDLVYKSDTMDWRKHRLAAQLKAAVEQIELIIAGFEANVVAVPVSPHPESESKQEFLLTVRQLVSDELIPEMLAPASWGRFADNVYALVSSYSRNRFSAPSDLATLTETIRTKSADGAWDVRSGSLFQFIIGQVVGMDSTGNINNFIVVESEELRDVHGVEAVPKPFLLDS